MKLENEKNGIKNANKTFSETSSVKKDNFNLSSSSFARSDAHMQNGSFKKKENNFFDAHNTTQSTMHTDHNVSLSNKTLANK